MLRNLWRCLALTAVTSLVAMIMSAWSSTDGGHAADELLEGVTSKEPPRAHAKAQIASSQMAAATSLRSPASAQFRRYREIPTAQGYRAFSVDIESGNWGQGASASQSRIAVDQSLADCRERAARDCTLYAMGDIVIHGLGDRRVEVAIVLYQLNPDASNEDVAAVFSTDSSATAIALRRSVLHAAAEAGNLGVVATMLDRGLAVDSKSAAGATALMYAASRGQARVVALLLERGADVNAHNSLGKTALNLALVAKRFADVHNYRTDDHDAAIRMLRSAGGKE